MIHTAVYLVHVSSLVCFISIAGWLLKSVHLISWIPGFAPMQVMTAATFLMGNLAMLALFSGKERICGIISSFILLLGIAILANNWLHLGIEHFFFGDYWYSENSPKPGQMSIMTNTALLGYTLFGMVWGLGNYSVTWKLGYSMAAIGISTTALFLGSITSLTIPSNSVSYTLMSIPTSVCLVAGVVSKYLYVKYICSKL